MSDELRNVEGDTWRIEQARAYMEHVRGLRLRIDALQIQIDDARANLLPGAVRYDKQGGVATSADDSLVDGISNVDELIAKYVEKMAEYVGALDAATDAIHSLHSGVYVKMLTLYYLDGRTWEDTATEINYSDSHMFRLCDCALLELYEVMPHTWRAPRYQAI